ncbi:hypothetical protein RHRU231_710127 [Rhodococcus ruber]|uniref:Uncharacterized protein n=1 Tax=Rhodococcus ruber TaxID=1830 RepID=A0A098BNY0_9NOCA|nr:hypothetical protein RHRU231_710127 [Rhodococcus ruber]
MRTDRREGYGRRSVQNLLEIGGDHGRQLVRDHLRLDRWLIEHVTDRDVLDGADEHPRDGVGMLDPAPAGIEAQPHGQQRVDAVLERDQPAVRRAGELLDEHAQQPGVLAECLEEYAHVGPHRFGPGGGVERIGEHVRNASLNLLGPPVDDFGHDGVLAGEVLVQRAGADTGGGGDPVGGGALVSVGEQDLPAGGHDALDHRLGAALPWHPAQPALLRRPHRRPPDAN